MTGLGFTLLVALVAALVLGALAHRLRLPPMLGYIAAGMAVGPFTPGFVADREEVLALADVGVALLMFSIGLQFSLGELRSVGGRILAGVPVQVALTMAIGTATGLALGWELLSALFIGGAVSVASTVVLVKVAGEAALHTTAYGRTALGVSIVQDLLTVVLVVGLSALGGQADESWLGFVGAIVVALGFVALVLFGGSRVLPRLLGFIAGLRSRELFVIAVAVISIGTAFAASALGVSVALGAFVAGLALADSDLTASVLGEIVPLRELFSTFFFVSIGILLQPAAILAAWPVVLALLLIITFGKALPIAGLAVLDGQSPSNALRAGALIGQSGEFSFVLASAGLALGAVAPETFSLAMGAVVISILTAEPLLAAARWIGPRLDAAMPRARAARRRATDRPATARRHPRLRPGRPVGCAGPRLARLRLGCRRQRLRRHARRARGRCTRDLRRGRGADGARPGRRCRRPTPWSSACPMRWRHARRSSTRTTATRGSRSSRAPTPMRRRSTCGGWAPRAWSLPIGSSATR